MSRMETSPREASARPLVGYYYTDWIWPERATDSMKSLLLFFDHLALVLPQRLHDVVVSEDPILALPLKEKGILLNLDPESWLEEAESDRIVNEVYNALAEDSIPRNDRDYASLTTAHFGFESRATQELLAKLQGKGLIDGQVVDSVVQMAPAARLIILTALASILYEKSFRQGLELSLITFENGPSVKMRKGQTAVRRQKPYRWYPESLMDVTREALEFVTLWEDFEAIGVDLSAVPLDEVLEFRQRHGTEYRAYIRGLRSFINTFRWGEEANDLEQFNERREELLDQSADLRRLSRRTFGRRAAILSVTAAAFGWSAYHGDPVSAALSSLAAALSLPSNPERSQRPFAYLFAIEDEFRRRRLISA
jgi:hypothetical protein